VNSRIVDHLVASEGLPRRSGLAFDYVLGGDGLFVVAANPWLDLRVPVARCTVRGLPPVYTACTLPHDRLPGATQLSRTRLRRSLDFHPNALLRRAGGQDRTPLEG